MKTITIIALVAAASISYADEEVVVKARSGRFKVTQEYQGDFVEIVRFSNPKHSPVRLSGVSWPGNYSISPNEHWLLRTQKTGSGQSIAILYRVEENGRVSEVLGFDSLLWGVSDAASRLKQKELYHTGIGEFTWSEDNRFLDIVLSGSNASKSGDSIECRIQYDLERNLATVKKSKSEQVADGNRPHAPQSPPKRSYDGGQGPWK